MMKNTVYVVMAIILLAGKQSIGQIKSNSETKKPNIIFIFTDDLGYGDVGVLFQNQRKKKGDRSQPWTATPNLDTMAHEGALLTQHYAAAPVCAPSRGSLLSGLSQGHANVRNNQFDKALADNHTLGNVMQKAGYSTAVVGKWGLQGDKRWSRNNGRWIGKPSKRGFDYFYGYMRHRDGHEHYPKEGIYRGKKEVWENDMEVSSGLDKCFTGDLWTAVAKKWITDQVQNNQKPFFMVLSYDTPHAVLELPTQAYPVGGGLHGGVQWEGKLGKMINTATGTPDTFVHADYADATYDQDKDQATPEVPWPDTYKRYATMVRRIDQGVGDILQLLKDLKIDDNTLVVFSSDNGPEKVSFLPKTFVENTPDFFDSYGPFDGIKRDVLEGGVRVPTIVRWPGQVPENSVVDVPSISYDWLPTFTDAAGLPAPANTDGVSLLPSLTGNGRQDEGLVYMEYFHNGNTPDYQEFSPHNRNRIRKEMQMIRKGDLIGLRYNIASADDDFEIYDALKDSHQGTDLASQDSMQKIQQWMKNRVLQVRRSDTSAVRPYDKVAVPRLDVKSVSNGLRWKAYQGDYPWLPRFKTLVSEKEGITDKPENMDYKKRPQNLYLFEGYIEVPEDGDYTFTFRTAEKGLIRLHDAILIDADYKYEPDTVKKTTLGLKKGMHPISIYVQNDKRIERPFHLEWQGPDSSKNVVGQAAFFH